MSRSQPGVARDLAELILGYGMILVVLWTPEHLQRILSPIALVATLLVVLARRQSHDGQGQAGPTDDELGLAGAASSLRCGSCLWQLASQSWAR